MYCKHSAANAVPFHVVVTKTSLGPEAKKHAFQTNWGGKKTGREKIAGCSSGTSVSLSLAHWMGEGGRTPGEGSIPAGVREVVQTILHLIQEDALHRQSPWFNPQMTPIPRMRL